MIVIHPDHLNTPQKMTDASGAIVWDRQQQPFGEDHSITGSASSVLRYPGQIADAESNLSYNYFRDYDPTLGRYIEADPIGLEGGINLYGYVGQNPLNWFDVSGLVCPPDQPLACMAHGANSGDFGGQGYGYATMQGRFWNSQYIVKYGLYDCMFGSGETCSFSGPGRPKTYDLYGVKSEERYIPFSGEFRSVPTGCEPFTIDPKNPEEYPTELFDAIKKGITDCRVAGTCLISNPPFNP